MKKLNINIFFHKRLVLVCGVFLCAAVFVFCNPSKKVARQLERINKLKNSFEKEKEAVCHTCINNWIENNPCEMGPAFDVDSLCRTQQRVRYVHDTINTETITEIETIPKNITNTIALPYLDLREIKRWKDSVYYYKSLCAYKDNVLLNERIDFEKNISVVEKKAKEKSIAKTPNGVWWFLAVLILYNIFIWLIKNRS